MQTDITDDEYIRRILEQNVRNIYQAQHLIVSRSIYLQGKELKATQRRKGIQRRTGKLEQSLANPDYYLRSEGERFVLSSNYLLYTRFLDMKHRGNWKVYNRPVFGILFNNAYRQIRFHTGQIIDKVGDALKEAVKTFNKK